MKRKTRVTARWLVSAILLCIAVSASPLHAALTETPHTSLSGSGPGDTEYEDTSAANTQLVLTTTAKDYGRELRSVSVVCSASATVTTTLSITRTITSGSVSILLPDVPLTATTSGALYASIPLSPADVVVVTVPAAGGVITCSAVVWEAKK